MGLGDAVRDGDGDDGDDEGEGVKVGGGQLFAVGWMVYYILHVTVRKCLLVKSAGFGDAHCSP